MFDTDFDTYPEDAIALFGLAGVNKVFENLEGFRRPGKRMRRGWRTPWTELRMRIREIAQTRVRYGYRTIRVLVNRHGWKVRKYLDNESRPHRALGEKTPNPFWGTNSRKLALALVQKTRSDQWLSG